MRKLLLITNRKPCLSDEKLIDNIRQSIPGSEVVNDDESCCWQLFADDMNRYYVSCPYFIVGNYFCSGQGFLPVGKSVSRIGFMLFEPLAMETNLIYKAAHFSGSVQVRPEDIADINQLKPIDDKMYLPLLISEEEEKAYVFSDRGRMLVCNAELNGGRSQVGDFNVCFRKKDAVHKIHYRMGALCGLSDQF